MDPSDTNRASSDNSETLAPNLSATTSLRRRIVLPIVSAFFLLLCIVSVFLIMQIERVEGMILQEDVGAFANSIEYAIDASEDSPALQRYVMSLGSSPNIEAIFVANFDTDSVIASSKRKWLGQSIGNVDYSLFQSHIPNLSRRMYGSPLIRTEERLMICAKRIRLSSIGLSESSLGEDGMIAVLYRSDAMAAKSLEVEVNAVLWNTAILAIIASITIWIIYRRAQRPIQAIVKAVETRSQETDFQIPSKLANDEIGTLARYLDQAFAHERTSRENEKQARQIAEEAALAKTQFLATMSHEIRTPLNGLVGTLHLMESSIGEENRSYLKSALRCSDDLIVLINDVLDISKMEAGKIDLEKRLFNAGKIIEDLCRLHYGRAAEKGIEIVPIIDPDPNANIAYGDSHRIGQIISNFLSNAVKFTGVGCVRVAMRFVEDQAKLRNLRIEVIDTGIGIPLHAQAAIFDSFTQADSTTTRKFGGTGLGLAICRKLAEAMDGEIGLESEEGHGSAFWIQIPQDAAPSIEESASPKKQAAKRLLFVDGSEAVRTQARRHLEYLGHSCVESDSLTGAREATERETSQTYDSIIVDERLYSSDFDKWARSRLNSEGPENTQIVLMRSAKIPLNERDRCGVIDKPVRLKELESILREDYREKTRKTPSNGYRQYPSARLLVVDDNPTNRMIAQSLLKRNHGIDSKSGNDGSVAIKMARESQYDLVLMDCMMPDIDGYRATQAIREGEAGPLNRNTPIIALTADAMKGGREKCLAAGMDDYLTKPMNPKSLAEALDKWLSKQATDASASPADEPPESTSLLDLESLTEALGNDRDLIGKVVSHFKSSLAESMDAIQSAMSASPNLSQLREIVHSIKGEASNFGVAAFVKEAECVEVALVNKKRDEAVQRIPEMLALASSILQEIESGGY